MFYAKLRFWGGLANDLANKITSIRLVSWLLSKDTRRKGRDTHLLMHRPNVRRTHLLRAEKRRIRRSVCRRLYANHTIYDWVKRRRLFNEVIVALEERGYRLQGKGAMHQ